MRLPKRKAASWMTLLDERILEHLDNADAPMTAWQFALTISVRRRGDGSPSAVRCLLRLASSLYVQERCSRSDTRLPEMASDT